MKNAFQHIMKINLWGAKEGTVASVGSIEKTTRVNLMKALDQINEIGIEAFRQNIQANRDVEDEKT